MSSPFCPVYESDVDHVPADKWWNMWNSQNVVKHQTGWISSGIRKPLMGCIILVWTAGSPSSPQTPSLVKALGGYLLFRVRESDWHFPLAVDAHLAAPSALFISAGLLSWNGTKLTGELLEIHGGELADECPAVFIPLFFWQMCRRIVKPQRRAETGISPNDILPYRNQPRAE